VPADIERDLALNHDQVAESEDSGTREIFGGLPALAAHAARWSRLVVDLNRPADDYGPRGVIAGADYFARPVFKPGREPDQSETIRRVKAYYLPYHDKLRESLSLPGVKLLLDCHSMDGVGPADAPDPGRPRADVNLGNNGGPGGEPNPERGEPTCPVELVRSLAEALRDEGLSVSLNSPYAGGYITLHYGALLRAQGKAALQMEMNKALYFSPNGRLNENKLDQARRAIQAALGKTAHLF
jgi:N-formylglutamate amidohydrolase